MIKHHKFISFCAGLLFLIVLQKFATPVPVFRFLIPAFLVYAAAVGAYNVWYLKKIERYNFWTVARSLMLLAAAFGIFFVLPSENLRGLFLISTVAIITFVEVILGAAAENILLNETLLIAFGLFLGLFGADYYFPSLQAWFTIGIFLSGALLSRSFYEFTPEPRKAKMVAAVIMGLFCSELYWALNFLHFYYSSLAVFLFLAFYFCLIINYYRIFHILNYKKLQFHLFLITCCAVLVLLTTPWKIIQ